METPFTQLFESLLFESFGREIPLLDFQVVAAGMVNTGARLVTPEGIYFVKINTQSEDDFFEAEAKDLEMLSTYLRTPKVYGWGKVQGYAYLLTEAIPESPPAKPALEAAGRQLAAMHQVRHEAFGHPYPNRLVTVSLDNRWKTDGISFMVQNRILPMVGLCLMEEKISLQLYKSIEALCGRLGNLIPEEAPSLLHGDLWTGNLLNGPGPETVFIDPAAYFGFREHELAFTHLFGGFEAPFYEAYLEVFPLEPGFGERVSIYHIHPLLVHVYLFGSGYIAGIERILKRFS
jgi:fructosamine-3-kinase